MMVVALFGTTLSPYVFFWQAVEEAEDIREIDHRLPLKRDTKRGPHELMRIELDTLAGMAGSNLVALAIIITTAATVERGTCSRVAIAQAVRRSWRAATIAAITVGEVRRGWRCGRDEASSSAGRPPRRCRRNHL